VITAAGFSNAVGEVLLLLVLRLLLSGLAALVGVHEFGTAGRGAATDTDAVAVLLRRPAAHTVLLQRVLAAANPTAVEAPAGL
jgi:hypothetical protein